MGEQHVKIRIPQAAIVDSHRRGDRFDIIGRKFLVAIRGPSSDEKAGCAVSGATKGRATLQRLLQFRIAVRMPRRCGPHKSKRLVYAVQAESRLKSRRTFLSAAPPDYRTDGRDKKGAAQDGMIRSSRASANCG